MAHTKIHVGKHIFRYSRRHNVWWAGYKTADLAASIGTRRRTIRQLSAVTLAGCGLLVASQTSDSHSYLRSRTLKADSRRLFASSNISDDSGSVSSTGKENGTYTANVPGHGEVGQQQPPSQTKASEEHDDKSGSKPSQWDDFLSGMAAIKWSSIPDKISDLVAPPQWLRSFPTYMQKFQNELEMAPGTLAAEIWQEANDPESNPEIMWDAVVRVSNHLCDEEQKFLDARKKHTRTALAKYLDISEHDIHPDDIPTIAMCGSGGGLRALVAGSGSYIAAREAGLFDCITYTAGVSGSCWLQTLYFSSVGKQNYSRVISHLKNRLGVHLAYPPAAFELLNSAPTNKFLLTGLVEKLKGMPEADFGIVDVYGLLLAARLLVPKAEIGVDLDDLNLSSQQRFVNQGQNPLPIYSAVRHEIPPEEQKDVSAVKNLAKKQDKQAWFQWFEFTPYEFSSEEVGAGIPIWSVGRQFDDGKTVWRENGLSLPEQRVPLLLGIWGSAFCATLSHYYKEIRPVMKGLAGFAGIDQMIAERDEDLVKRHPIDPAAIPNFARGMKSSLPSTCPESMFKASHLQLMDAGMSNNLPIYPLLRPGREVDIIVAFDSSADVKTDNWLKVVDGYARQRGVKGWPIGAGWPSHHSDDEQIKQELQDAQAADGSEAKAKLAKAQKNDQSADAPKSSSKSSGNLGYCNVWIGSTEERVTTTESPAKLVEEDWELMKDDAGITVVYFPLLVNSKAPGVDPKTSDYLSTWNFVYSPEQIDNVVALARANYEEGAEQTKRTIRAVYERKKKGRLEREEKRKSESKSQKLRSGVRRGRKLGEGDHGDHFS